MYFYKPDMVIRRLLGRVLGVNSETEFETMVKTTFNERQYHIGESCVRPTNCCSQGRNHVPVKLGFDWLTLSKLPSLHKRSIQQ